MAAIVRLDLMSADKLGSKIKSAKYLVGSTPTEIQNGMLVALGGLAEGEREIFTAKAPTDATAKVALVASPELIYDESPRKSLADFTNAAGAAIRTFVLEAGDIWSVTGEVVEGAVMPKVGDVLVPTANKTTYTIAAEVTTQFVVGTVIAVEVVSGKTFYVIQH